MDGLTGSAPLNRRRRHRKKEHETQNETTGGGNTQGSRTERKKERGRAVWSETERTGTQYGQIDARRGGREQAGCVTRIGYDTMVEI